MPVVKADAYGHGAGPVARRLEREGATAFAVAVAEEGAELRRAGVAGEILVMGWIGTDQLPDLLRFGLVPNAHSVEMLVELAAFAAARGVTLPVHLKLDTGMTRLGLLPDDVPAAIEVLRRARGLEVAGCFQNFASADDPASPQTASQLATFRDVVRAFAAAGLGPGLLHVANSAGTEADPPWPEGLPPAARVRPGLSLFTRLGAASSRAAEAARDVMSLVTVVDQVKTVPSGTRVGYGGTWTAPRATRLAILPIGYADGVPRSLSGSGVVMIRGSRCPIVGRISMDLTAVDVTDLSPAPRHGEDVFFFGFDPASGGRLGVEELAAAAGTVHWEVLCGVGPRVPRVVVEEGAPTRVVSRFFVAGVATADEREDARP